MQIDSTMKIRRAENGYIISVEQTDGDNYAVTTSVSMKNSDVVRAMKEFLGVKRKPRTKKEETIVEAALRVG